MKSALKGFTLIEILIVVSILFTLMGLGLAAFRESKAAATDSKRKTELTNIAQALELYYQKNREYPDSGGKWITSSSGSSTWIVGLVPDFINSLPLDPNQNALKPYRYISVPDSASNNDLPTCSGLSQRQFYVLAANLQLKTDKESVTSKNIKYCNGNPLSGYQPFNTRGTYWFALTTQ